MQANEVHKTLDKHILADGAEIVVDLVNSKGAYLRDQITGRDYMDFFSYFASQPVGHNHEMMHDPEFLEKLTLAAISKPSSSDFYTTFLAEFIETFGRIAMPADMPNLFLVSGGALAVENALKAAFDWKVRKNFEHIKAGDEYTIDGFGGKILHFKEAFHGRSGYTLSLTNTDDPRKYMYFPKFDWPRIVNPKLRYPLTDEIIAETKMVEEMALQQIVDAVRQYKGQIAALIIEPIQGEGGDNHFRPEFFAEIRKLADEHEFLFILDEIQSGMGLTGKMWSIEHTDTRPDIISFGKKSQVCGFIANKRVEEVTGHVFEESSRINSTWGGNLVDMVRATRFLEIMEEKKLLAHTTEVGNKMIEGLENIADESKGMITNVRGKGLMIAYDLPDQEKRDLMIDEMYNNGLIALKSGNRSIRFRGMLDTPMDVIQKALEIVAKNVPIN